MPLFGEAVSPFDEVIEKVTAETCTAENWTLILDICDRVVTEQSKGAKTCLVAVKKRLNHRDPHVILLALSVLDSLWSNCGVPFRREVSSREFSQELSFNATHSNRSIAEKTRSLIKKWAENECTKDPSLGLIETLYKDLLKEGLSFDVNPPTKMTAVSTDPNVVHSAEEEEAIARAIALSLDDSPRASSVYPSANTASAAPKCEEHDVRALYDFEAAEDNELTLATGDVLTVTDDSDPNWWRGKSHRGQGLFPASFVTAQLAEPEQPRNHIQPSPQPVRIARIDEKVLEDCLRLLEDCDPTGETADPPQLADAETNSLAQGPLIDARLAEIDKQHNALAQVDIAIRDVLAMYDRAVQQAQYQVDCGQQMPAQNQPYTEWNGQSSAPTNSNV